jgi:hypothetical protein
VQGLLQQLQRRELGISPHSAGTPAVDTSAASASGHTINSRPSTSSSSGSGRMQQQAVADAYGSGRSLARSASRSTAAAMAAAAICDAAGGRPMSARPQSASRPHTASSGSNRVGTPQQQLQRHMQPQQQQQQYRLLQASEAFQVCQNFQ